MIAAWWKIRNFPLRSSIAIWGALREKKIWFFAERKEVEESLKGDHLFVSLRRKIVNFLGFRKWPQGDTIRENQFVTTFEVRKKDFFSWSARLVTPRKLLFFCSSAKLYWFCLFSFHRHRLHVPFFAVGTKMKETRNTQNENRSFLGFFLAFLTSPTHLPAL